MSRYESHLTFEVKDEAIIKKFANHFWKFSKICGCPLMGDDKTYCYLTGYATDGNDLFQKLQFLIEVCKIAGAEPLRSKIEHIVFDSKTNVDELTRNENRNPTGWDEGP